jgi:cardiolipin synthase A/B
MKLDGAESITVDGNRLTPLSSGRARFDALIALIDGAQDSLRLLYYIYADDHAGRSVRDALQNALERGVKVGLIVDGFGCAVPPDFFQTLQQRGADICRFIPRFGRRYLLRNHQKMILADDRKVIVGGFNIEDSYFAEHDGWRDLGLVVEGPAAARLAGYFDALARWTHDPRPSMRQLRAALSRWSNPRGSVCWLLGGPTRPLSPWAKILRRDLLGGSQLEMIAAYFAPSPGMLRAIEGVARRGQARIVTAAKSDNDATIAAARHTYHRLLKRGVRVFEYQPTRLHTKLFVIGDVVHVGSANFDVRSLYLNLEIMLRVEDRAFAAMMRAYVEQEIDDSREILPDAHERAGWIQRLKWSLAYFLVAVADNNITRRLNFGPDGR